MKFKFLQLFVLTLLISVGTPSFSQTTMVVGGKMIKTGADTKLVIGSSGNTTNIQGTGGLIEDRDGTTILAGSTNFSGIGQGIANTPYAGDEGPIASFYNLEIDHAGFVGNSLVTSSILANTAGKVFVKNELIPKNGAFSVLSDSGLVMKSTSYTSEGFPVGSGTTRQVTSGTPAVIASPNCSGANAQSIISGNITVERPIANTLISARLITPGVIPLSTIRDNWQEGGTAYDHYGTLIYGSAGSGGGFDGNALSGNRSTIAMINAEGTAYNYVLATNSSQDAFGLGKGLLLTVYGDRRYDATNSVVDNEVAGSLNDRYNYTILRTTGRINQCDYTFSDLPASTGQYANIGNPFWAYYNLTAATRTNVSATYNYLDPHVIGTNKSRGKFIEGNFVNAGPGPVPTLDPGQGIIIQTDIQTAGVNPSLVFPASGIISKASATDGGLTTFSTKTTAPREHLMIDGFIQYPGQSSYHVNPFSSVRVSYSSDFSDGIGEEDSKTAGSSFENLVINRDGTKLAIEGRKPVAKIDTVHLELSRLFNGDANTNQAIKYGLSINTNYLNGDKLYVLFDKSANTFQSIPAFSKEMYDLTIETGKKNEDKYAVLILDKSYQTLLDYMTSKEKLNMAVYPNPSADYITVIDQKLAGSSVEIISTNGKNILSRTMDSSDNLNKTGVQFDVRNYATGAYFVRLKTTDGEIKTQKFIKE